MAASSLLRKRHHSQRHQAPASARAQIGTFRTNHPTRVLHQNRGYVGACREFSLVLAKRQALFGGEMLGVCPIGCLTRDSARVSLESYRV